MKQEKSCGAVIFNENGEFLLIHQVQGHWCFPKGHVEDGETEQQTALREIKEETGLDVTLLDGFRYVLQYQPSENVMKDVIYFCAKLEGGIQTPQLSEVQEVGWFHQNDVERIVTFENDRQLFQAAREFLEKSNFIVK